MRSGATRGVGPTSAAAAFAALAALAALGCAEEIIVTVDGAGMVNVREVVVSSGGAEEHVELTEPMRELPFTIGLALRNATAGPVTVCVSATGDAGDVAGCASARLVRLGANHLEITLCGPGEGDGPDPRLPGNATHVGTAIAAGTMRPTFGWDVFPGALGYEIQLSTDPTFPAGGILRAVTTTTRYRPADDLPVSMTPPVGARYHWRVRALLVDACSDQSADWYVDVGRPPHDFNGDGYGDVAAGARAHDEPAVPGTTNAGAAYVYYGRAGNVSDTLEPDLKLFGTATGDEFGRDLAFAGDVNGDGFADLLVGAPGAANAMGVSVGRVYLFHGGVEPDDEPDRLLEATTGQTEVGWSVAAAGDVDADGFADIVVGALGMLTGTGQVAVLLGRADDAEPLALAFGSTGLPGDRIGFDVAGVGDLDGDGRGDVAVGAPDTDGGAALGIAGAVYVFRGQVTAGTIAPTVTLFGPSDGALFGLSVAAAGDVNGDGFADLLVGAPGGERNKAVKPDQRVEVWLGAPVGLVSPTPIVLLPVEGASRGFGFSVSSAGDVDGDGADDVLVGARWTPGANGVGEGGSAAIFLGAIGAEMDSDPDALLAPGASSLENLGAAVTSVDFNGDGRSDVVLGAPNASGAAGFLSGKAYVFLNGGMLPPLDAVLELAGENALDLFGNAVAAWWTPRRSRAL